MTKPKRYKVIRKVQGRPIKEINYEDFEKLCSLHCTEVEIAEFFKVSVDTINRACIRNYGETFAETFKKKCSNGKISLRRKQFELAMSGNVPLLIWLGKQILGQSEKIDQKIDDSRAEQISNDLFASLMKQNGPL